MPATLLPSPTRHRSNHHLIALHRTPNTMTTTTVHIVSAYFHFLQYSLPCSLEFASLKFLESSVIVILLKIIIIGALATAIGYDMVCDWRLNEIKKGDNFDAYMSSVRLIFSIGHSYALLHFFKKNLEFYALFFVFFKIL